MMIKYMLNFRDLYLSLAINIGYRHKDKYSIDFSDDFKSCFNGFIDSDNIMSVTLE